MRRSSVRAITILATLSSLVACGGAAGEAVRPEAPTAAEAVGETVHCDVAGEKTSPLVVDWPSQHRVDLEVAMKSGVAVVRYACDEVEVLTQCSLPGSYAFTGVSLKEDVIRWDTRDEIAASLPIGVAKLGASLESGSSIQLAVATVGKATTAWREVFDSELPASCKGATHVVRAATLGAFSMGRGSRGQVMTAAQVFDLGGKASSMSDKDVHAKDGDLAACRKGSPDDRTAPAQCGATLRVELVPILPAQDKPAETKKPLPILAGPAVDVASVAVCGRPGNRCDLALGGPGICRFGDEGPCREACAGGNLPSCQNLAIVTADFVTGSRTDADDALSKACDGGLATSCMLLGDLHRARKESESAAALHERACQAGVADACASLGRAYAQGGARGPDPSREQALESRACDLGSGAGCWFLANSFFTASPAKVEPGTAALDRGCRAGHADSCARLAIMFYQGRDTWIQPNAPVTADAGKAESYVRRRCQLDAAKCGSLDKMFTGDEAARARYRALVCKLGATSLCASP